MAVAAALTLFLGVALGRNDSGRLDRLEALAQDMEKAVVSNAAYAALNDSHNEQIRLVSSDGTATAQVVRRPDGTGYLVPGTLDPLPDGRVYQLWAVRSDAKISLGVLGAVPEVSAFRMNGPVAAFAVTEEKAVRPIRSGGREYYCMVVHPRQGRDLKLDPTYQTILRTAEKAGGVSTTEHQPVIVGYTKA